MSLAEDYRKKKKYRTAEVKSEYNMEKYDLEERLVDFAVRIIELSEKLLKNRIGLHIADQLSRAGTSPASNYGEAQSAESRSDFVHKMKICLKELRETRVWLLIINRLTAFNSIKQTETLIAEVNELISIFVKCIKTAET